MFDPLREISKLSTSRVGQVAPINDTIKIRRKNVRNRLIKKYKHVFPDAKFISCEVITLNSLIGWPEGVDWRRITSWSSSDLDNIEASLDIIEFKALLIIFTRCVIKL